MEGQHSGPADGDHGAFGWENWRAYCAGRPSRGAYEVTCYTDAHVTGHVGEGLGPYALHNTVPRDRRVGDAKPSIVLRVENHAEWSPPPPDKATDHDTPPSRG